MVGGRWVMRERLAPMRESEMAVWSLLNGGLGEGAEEGWCGGRRRRG